MLLIGCAPLAAPRPCPPPDGAQSESQALYGTWQAEIAGLPDGRLVLRQHPDYAGSLSGQITRAGQTAQVAGDIEAGQFTLEESADGRRTSGRWQGQVVAASCGREIRGSWIDARQEKAALDGRGQDVEPPHSFILRRLVEPAW